MATQDLQLSRDPEVGSEDLEQVRTRVTDGDRDQSSAETENQTQGRSFKQIFQKTIFLQKFSE